MSASSELEFFLQVNVDSPQRWKDYQPQNSQMSFREATQRLVKENLAAESAGFTRYESLRSISNTDKAKLLEAHAMLTAEAFIYLESLINVAFRKVSQGYAEGMARSSIRKFLREEILHSRGFRRYLNYEKPFDWPNESFMIEHNRRLKRLLVSLMRRVPLAVCFVAAKVEYYSVSYAMALRDDYKDIGSNPWVDINIIHAKDEGTHAPMQFDLYDYQSDHNAKLSNLLIKVPIATVIIYLCMQILLFSSIFRLIAKVFPHVSWLTRMKRVFAFSRWMVRDFEAYRIARSKTRKLFDDKKPRFGNFYRFIYW